MKTYGGMEVYLHAFSSALLGGEWPPSRNSRIIPGTHWIGDGWALAGNRTPVVQPVT